MSGHVSCRVKKNALLNCGRRAAGSCQYCGRPFCAAHGNQLEDGQEICSRVPCQAKRADLELHLRYREEVLGRNRLGRCGQEGCDSLYGAQCSKCLGYYCEVHVSERPHHVVIHGQRTPRMGALCEHCWQRREIWERF